MPYTAEISRTNPTCVLFLVDQSSSMNGPFAGQPGKSKAEGVADAINRLLQNLVLKCAKSEGVRDYFHLGVIGYGADAHPALGGALANQGLVTISALANAPIRVEKRTRQVEDGTGGVVEQAYKFPVWFEPVAKGKTAMCAAFQLARTLIEPFLARYPTCFPPLVIHLTDGRATDGEPRGFGMALRKLASTDGNVLLFNVHLSSLPNPPTVFPSSAAGLSDDFAVALYEMSSQLPPKLLDAARTEGYAVVPASRGFAFNADLVAVIRFLDIGTRVAATLR